jgi:hypothetical protein
LLTLSAICHIEAQFYMDQAGKFAE